MDAIVPTFYDMDYILVTASQNSGTMRRPWRFAPSSERSIRHSRLDIVTVRQGSGLRRDVHAAVFVETLVHAPPSTINGAQSLHRDHRYAPRPRPGIAVPLTCAMKGNDDPHLWSSSRP